MCILNNGAPTRIGYNSESAIDITICSAALTPLIDWSLSTSPGDSDHCPIQINFMKQNTVNIAQTVSWNYKKADWLIFSNAKVWGNFLDVVTTPNEQLILDLYTRFYQAAQNVIPTFKPYKHIPKPWWTDELDELKFSKAQRERHYQNYRRDKTIPNLVKWKKA